MVEIRPATVDDVAAVTSEPTLKTGRTFAVEMDGEPVAVCGYYFDQGRVVIYSVIGPKAKEKSAFYALDLVRCARSVIREAEALEMPIYAGADPDIPGSDKLLKYLGFQHVERGIYEWHKPH